MLSHFFKKIFSISISWPLVAGMFALFLFLALFSVHIKAAYADGIATSSAAATCSDNSSGCGTEVTVTFSSFSCTPTNQSSNNCGSTSNSYSGNVSTTGYNYKAGTVTGNFSTDDGTAEPGNVPYSCTYSGAIFGINFSSSQNYPGSTTTNNNGAISTAISAAYSGNGSLSANVSVNCQGPAGFGGGGGMKFTLCSQNQNGNVYTPDSSVDGQCDLSSAAATCTINAFTAANGNILVNSTTTLSFQLNGSYNWNISVVGNTSGSDPNPTSGTTDSNGNPTNTVSTTSTSGNQTYTLSCSATGQTTPATAQLTVTHRAALFCQPINQNTTPYTSVALSASGGGGSGSYTWTSPGSPGSSNSDTYNVSFSTPSSNNTVTVSSFGSSKTCNVCVSPIITSDQGFNSATNTYTPTVYASNFLVLYGTFGTGYTWTSNDPDLSSSNGSCSGNNSCGSGQLNIQLGSSTGSYTFTIGSSCGATTTVTVTIAANGGSGGPTACVISSFTAANSNPAANTNTSISFVLNGSYPWTITTTGATANPDPNITSGSASSDTLYTSSTSGTQVYKLSCSATGQATPATSSVTVTHQASSGGGTCTISSFSAANANPAANATTTLSFALNGSYPWTITPAYNTSTPDPDNTSGTGSSGTVSTTSTTGTQTYTLNCGSSSQGVTVTHQASGGGATCSISSFAAANANPQAGATTTLTFVLGGSYPWTITTTGAATNPDPNVTSGTNNGATVNTTSTTGTQTYKFSCSAQGQTNPTTSSVTVTHQSSNPPCNITSFTATNPNPADGATTTLYFGMNDFYYFTITSTGNTTTPDPSLTSGQASGTGDVPEYGGIPTTSTTGTQVYTLSCSATSGGAATDSKTVTVTHPGSVPACSIASFTAANSTPSNGNTTTLSLALNGSYPWTISVSGNNANPDPSPNSGNTDSGGSPTGTINTTSTTGTQTYTLTCGSQTLNTSVVHQASPPPATCTISSFAAGNANPASGATTTLAFSLNSSNAWTISSTGATTNPDPDTTSGNGGSGTVNTTSTSGTQNYTLSCSAAGQATPTTSSVTVTHQAANNPPAAPILTAFNTQLDNTVQCGHVQLRWNAINGADGYYLYKTTDTTNILQGGNPWVTISNSGTTTYDWIPDQGYYYYIKAYSNANGISSLNGPANGALVSATPCSADFSPSDKVLDQVNGKNYTFTSTCIASQAGSVPYIINGNVATFSINLCNHGEISATSVTVKDTPTNVLNPRNFRCTGCTGSMTESVNGNSVTFSNIGSIAPNAIVQIMFDGDVTAPAGADPAGESRMENVANLSFTTSLASDNSGCKGTGTDSAHPCTLDTGPIVFYNSTTSAPTQQEITP